MALEKALYVAEGGMERAVAYIMNGGITPFVLKGSLGEGTYVTTILADSGTGCLAGNHDIDGGIKINPNNSVDNEFTLMKPDGSEITRDNLHEDYPGYFGEAILVHVKPAGNGNQNTMTIDGQVFQLLNANTYDISSASMTTIITNDIINPVGKAIGKWWINITAGEATIQSSGSDGDDVTKIDEHDIISHGVVGKGSRTVVLDGLRRQSWAKYALWSNDNRSIYFKDGEVFYGPVHSNTKLYFNTVSGSTNPPTFHGKVTSAESTVGPNSDSADDCVFHEGLYLDSPAESMVTVDFSELRSDAAIIVTGETSVVFDGDTIRITNDRSGWTNHEEQISGEMLIYVESSGIGLNKYGDVGVGGVVDGRITIVSERDINITNHITCTEDPKTNDVSDDAVGLISKRDVVVKPSCPGDLTLYAHIMATGVLTVPTSDGSFGVEDYSLGDPRGTLTVHGGIVQDYRGPVGTFSTWSGMMTHGFAKNYTYDSRFSVKPPPHYPSLLDKYEWDTWRDEGP